MKQVVTKLDECRQQNDFVILFNTYCSGNPQRQINIAHTSGFLSEAIIIDMRRAYESNNT